MDCPQRLKQPERLHQDMVRMSQLQAEAREIRAKSVNTADAAQGGKKPPSQQKEAEKLHMIRPSVAGKFT